MSKTQSEYEKNPEKHPMYPEEWKKYWNKRYKEIQAGLLYNNVILLFCNHS